MARITIGKGLPRDAQKVWSIRCCGVVAVPLAEVHLGQQVVADDNGLLHLFLALLAGPGFGRTRVAHFAIVAVIADEMRQMVASTFAGQVSVVARGRDADRASAPSVDVAKLISDRLQLVWCEVIVVSENVVMRWPTGSLNAEVTA